ncbi:binding-protein-dependent transport systems inner membrane component (plasmid) [Ketogulonicigenium vulgare Y25]|uniref:ABC transporter permease protein n=1 Tax=Ketogulonicigenium vulgare (strain WSH-001) TaxID=759362 RepID=F9YBP9_KETVW|nr:ABC transporter permease [Ketogulonicigenium vulgare]ADO44366.1 binding-protein-dependent transport systems inner membrane component [Ketogulonicigenium vulgare Y25]AEM42801.1 ABC transporter permease protein [Ketogulonicigenium vulgare WSH-001]ALJ82766.1 peptide ABC transporter permease [Ketogulonicigenium vulgare]
MTDLPVTTDDERRADRRAFVTRALRLIISVAVTLLGLITLTFFIGRLLPLDPVLAILGDNVSQEAYDRMRTQLGLDQPIWVQYWMYLTKALTLDFGMSLTSSRPVVEDIARVFPATIELATVAIFIGTFLGIPAGVLAAMYRGSIFDHMIRLFSLVIYSMPNFWLGLMGLMVFYAGLGWVAGPGRIGFVYEFSVAPGTGFLLIDTALQGNWDAFKNVFSHIILPASLLGFGAMAYISRMTRSFMTEQLSQEYIITARVKGLSWARTVWGHAFRNIAVQLATVVALSYAFLLEGAVLIETVFVWPGFGRYLTTALMAGDMNAVVGCTLVVGIIFVVINLICDLLYRVLDPRTR